jgi:GMP synthase (glutamine-hydrolysing)
LLPSTDEIVGIDRKLQGYHVGHAREPLALAIPPQEICKIAHYRMGSRMSAPTQPILIVLHQESSTPGRVGHGLQERGYRLDIRRPRFGEPLPETMAEHAGAIIFGGPMSANDGDDFVRRETAWIAVALRENKPFLGICLGAQMLACHLGGRVYPHTEGCAEIGYYPIRPTDIGREVCDPWPEQVYQWHREGFDLPPGAELLAEGDMFPVQAFRIGAAYALQFHPDVTHATICRWTTRSHARLSMPGTKPRVAHFADRAVYDPAGRAWLAAFLSHWLGQTAG